MAAQASSSTRSATLRSSATKTAASTYYFTASLLHMHSLVREKMWWWLALARKKMWLWIASFGESYNGDVEEEQYWW